MTSTLDRDVAGILAQAARIYPKRQDASIAVTAKQAAQYFDGPVDKGWYRIQRNDYQLNVAVVDNLDTHRFPLMHPTNLEITNQALRVWQLFTGRPWYLTPGIAGSDVLEPLLKAIKPRGARFRPRETGPEERDGAVERPYTDDPKSPYHWKREEDGAKYVCGYDVTRMYLAAAGNAQICPWTLKETGKIPFDPKLAGWWLIEVPPWNDDRLPDPAGYGPPVRWVTTPTAKLLWELEQQGLSAGFKVIDSWTGVGKGSLRPWKDIMERGYQESKAHNSTLLPVAFKQAARETIGLFKSSTYTTYRPDWHYTIVALARTNLWRKIRLVADSEGRWPLSVATDNVRYATPVPDPVSGCPTKLVLGDRLGQFKPKAA